MVLSTMVLNLESVGKTTRMWPSNKNNRAARWFQPQLTLIEMKFQSRFSNVFTRVAYNTICDNHLKQKCVNPGDRMGDLSVSDHYEYRLKKRKKINELKNEDKKLRKEDFITLFLHWLYHLLGSNETVLQSVLVRVSSSSISFVFHNHHLKWGHVFILR